MSAVHDALKGKHRREDATPSGGTVPPPLLADAALYGPLGDYVRTVAPHTEAAPAAILAAALAALGAIIGRGPAWHFGGDEHHARAFVLLVGPTGAGRKGTAINEGVKRLLTMLDVDFYRERCVSGLSSAEGLIAEVRDATPDQVDPLTGKVKPGDPGVRDKRLLVIEHEFASAMQAMAREGNRLSPVLRDAWDGRDLRTMVKRDPQRATAPHVAIVAAVTPSELGSSLQAVAVRNGLANRFLPIWCGRARLLPHDTAPDPAALESAVAAVARSVVRARQIGGIRWTPAAAEAWGTLYESLAIVPDNDVVRALTERGAPYVRRLAMLYALLDGTGDVDVPHLEAACALWEYAAGTWRTIYASGGTLAPLAARFLEAIEGAGADGCTRTDLRKVAGSNNLPAAEIDAALHELASAGLAQREHIPTAGRPREVWRHARHAGAGDSSPTSHLSHAA